MAGYGDAYETYFKLSWAGVLPLKTLTKWPPPDGYTGYDGVNPSFADMTAWAQNGRHGDNTAIRLGPEEIGLDVDHYGDKHGGDTIAEGEKRWGKLPPTYRSTSRDDGISGIKVFRVPPGTVLKGKLAFPELGLGSVETIQWFHRYVMCWPSWHPEGRQYRWFNETTGEWVDDPPSPAHLADLPQKWLEELSVTAADLVEPGAETYDVAAALTDGLPSDKVARRLTEAIADATGQNRHDGTCKHVLALLRYGKNGEAGTKVALIALQATFVEAVTAPGPNQRTRAEAIKEFGRYITNERAGKLLAVEPDPDPAKAFWQPGGERVVAAAVSAQAVAVTIDEEAFWNEYPELTACRDYARSVRVGPWAMLGSALTVASATIPPDVVLPAGVGDYASVNLFVNLVGESGAIKSQAVNAGRAWLHIASPPDPVKPGSGQGVAKCFASVKRTKRGPVQVGRRWAAVATIAEVDTLTAAGSMTGSNLWAELRSAWSDERVGHDYADVTKSVVLQPRRYRLTMVVGVQPLRAGPIFEDVDAGSPQRFAWMPTDDPGAPKQRPAACDRLPLPAWGENWMDPTPTVVDYFRDIDQERADLLDKPCDRDKLTVLKIPPEALDAVDTLAFEKLHSSPNVNPLDGHRNLVRLKVAAALMRLCNRTEVTSKDWELAGIVMQVSDRTRGQVKDKLDADRNRRNRYIAEVSGARRIVETQMAAKAEAEDIARVADVIVAALTKAVGQTLTGSAVRKAADSRDRTLVDKALEYLDIDGRVEIEKVVHNGREGLKVTLLNKTQQTK